MFRTHMTIVAAIGLCAVAAGQPLRFTLDRSVSGIDAQLSVRGDTAGTLIGDYDAKTNPEGTRTKPGLFGTFGATENVAVPTTVDVSFGGRINTDSTGTFDVRLDVAGGTAEISNYSADLLGGRTIRLPLTVTLSFQTFRTRNPTFTYLGIPLPIPLGEADVTAMTLTQVGSQGPGTLVQTGPDTYDTLLLPIVEITAEGSFLGQPFSIPGAPTVLPIEGVLTITPGGATIAGSRPIDFSDAQALNQALPQMPLALPTATTGVTANVLLDLVLESISSTFAGTQTVRATGVPIPCPADLTGDGVVDFNDLLAFLNLFNAGDPRADFNGDGTIDFNDFLAYMNLFNGGC
ncbi:MAG: hypothetical protein FJ255_11090 [Phycisphaerae bacterium]|nr:hypothetical protein [Phycisphaerae bacterium]